MMTFLQHVFSNWHILIPERHRASRDLFATAELLAKLTVINCHFTLASGSLNFCTKIRGYCTPPRTLHGMVGY